MKITMVPWCTGVKIGSHTIRSLKRLEPEIGVNYGQSDLLDTMGDELDNWEQPPVVPSGEEKVEYHFELDG